MSTAYNVRNRLSQSSNADRGRRVDPGNGGTIKVSPVDDGVIRLSGGGARTLEAATNFGIGTSILICAVDANVTVNTTFTVALGTARQFVVGLNSSGGNQWQAFPASATV